MMKSMAKVIGLVGLVAVLSSGCATTPPMTDERIVLPASFQEVWYRSTLEKPGFLVMTDTGTVTVNTDAVTFVGKKGSKDIDYEKIRKVAFGKVGSDFINKWVTVTYRDGETDSYALFSGGKALGWSGSGVAARLFQSIRFALDQKGLASVVQEQ